MKTDIQIAQEAKMLPISEIAAKIGLDESDIEYYGHYKAKVSAKAIEGAKHKPNGKLILVTAINPTAAGEGKTTTTVGLGQAMSYLGKKAMIALREPSLGPCFGTKGGAAGGGYAQAVPMEDINLHFTGDFHAITSAHNLLAALLDNCIHQGNRLGIDPRQIVFRRVMDMNDRSLRNIVLGLGGKTDGVPREGGFDITVASEVMAILCLAEDLMDLKERLSKMVVAYTYSGNPVTAGDLDAHKAMTLLLKDAIKPNLVQTLENTPAFIHGGPFANIAHGCNSVSATKLGLKLTDYLITEAGFGSDLGAEKFFNLKCRYAGLNPDLTVLVATIRALKMNGGVSKELLDVENPEALKKGLVNLEKHLEIIARFGVPRVVSLNRFPSDTERELEIVRERCRELGVEMAVSEVFTKGGPGGVELAQKILDTLEEQPSQFKVLYSLEDSIEEKIAKICCEIYGADNVVFGKKAKADMARYQELGYGQLPICMAKTQYSLTDNPELLGRPQGFEITVREIRLMAGAGFLVAITGTIMTMPGLPKRPAAAGMDVDREGRITGLF